jgi:hypothetical protein
MLIRKDWPAPTPRIAEQKSRAIKEVADGTGSNFNKLALNVT